MNHLQDLLPQPPWQPHPTPTQPHPGPTLTSSSGGHLTDLAQAAHTRTDTQLHPSTTLSTSLSQPSPSRSPKDEPHPHISSINLNPETHSTPCAQSARAASCQSPGKADWWREDTFDHQPNAKRTRVGQSDCQPALAVSGSRAQVVPSCRHGTTGAADPDPNQQANSDCGRGQQACVLGGFPAEEDGQSSLSGVGVWEVPVQQGGAEGACLKGGLQRRAPRLQSLLMRLIDDFLFITPSRTAAEALVNKLLKGMHLTKKIVQALPQIVYYYYYDYFVIFSIFHLVSNLLPNFPDPALFCLFGTAYCVGYLCLSAGMNGVFSG